MEISELKSPYKELAELRRNNGDSIKSLIDAFTWGETPEGDDFWDDVCDGEHPPIPTESLKELGEYVIGEEYEFSDWGISWHKGKLLVIVDHEYKYIIQPLHINCPIAYKQIRHIQPKVKEVTIEEIAEKFGVSVDTIKIKK